MEGGLPMLNCLLQHTLRSFCSSNSDPSKWVYAVFWRILPRNYPPPKWDYGGSLLDRSHGNKRNWILVWEDAFCDFFECERVGNGHLSSRFGADVFFKMSHEVYNYGEGVVGKVAAENSHKWVFKENSIDTDPTLISAWNLSIEPQPKAWGIQFNSGIQTIALISVREGIIQLGSFDKVVEDLNLVISIQRKFSYLQSIPGVFAMQRPYLPVHYPYVLKSNIVEKQDKKIQSGKKRMMIERQEEIPVKSINLGWNSPQNGVIGTPYLPSMSLGALLSKFPSLIPSYDPIEASSQRLMKFDDENATNASQEEEHNSVYKIHLELHDGKGNV